MSDNRDCVQLSEYCFDVCEALKTVLQGNHAGDPGEPIKVALVGLERCAMNLAPIYFPLNNPRVVCEIEQTLRRGVDGSHAEYNKGKIGDHKLEIQEILCTLNAPLNTGFARDVCAPPSTRYHQDNAAASASENGAYSAHSPPTSHKIFADRSCCQLRPCSLRTFDQTRVHSR